MKFALNIDYMNYNSKERVTAFTGQLEYYKGNEREYNFHVNALVLTTEDFSINLDSDIIQIVSDSCSVQYRPKGLHKNTKGVFYKINGKSVYLNSKEVVEMGSFISEANKKKDAILRNNNHK